MPKTRRLANAVRSRPSRTSGAPAKQKKISKRLDAIARQIKDADEFVNHVAGLSNRYRRELALRAGAAQAAMRQSTREFHKHALALSLWLQRAHESNATAIEREALDKMGAAALRPQSTQALDWLLRASKMAAESIATMSRRRNDNDGTALRIAAEGLRATFDHHGLKVLLAGPQQPTDAVRLLCAIARDAGDAALDPDAAKAALRDSKRLLAG
jgi:hypothetical protein